MTCDRHAAVTSDDHGEKNYDDGYGGGKRKN